MSIFDFKKCLKSGQKLPFFGKCFGNFSKSEDFKSVDWFVSLCKITKNKQATVLSYKVLTESLLPNGPEGALYDEKFENSCIARNNPIKPRN